MKHLPSIYLEPIFLILSITTTVISLAQPKAVLEKMERILIHEEPWARNDRMEDLRDHFQFILKLIAIPLLSLATKVWSAYSDKTGRQQPMLIAIFSIVWSVLGWMLVLSPSLGWNLWCKIPFILVECLSGGGMALFTIAVYAFMADIIENKETLTVRLNILSILMPISIYAVKAPATSIMDSLSPFSFARSMVPVLALLLLAFVYILARIPQIPPILLTEQSHPVSPSNDIEKQQKSQGCSPLCVLTPLAMLRDMFRASFKPREGHVRLLVWLICILTFITTFTPSALRHGRDDFFFLDWAKRYHHDLTKYKTIGLLIATFGTVFGIVVSKKVLHLCDTTVMLISLSSTIAAHIFLAFATDYNLIFYGINIAAVFSGLQIPTGFAYLAKLVPKHELGRVFMLLTIFSVLGRFLGPFIMKPIYRKTILSCPNLIWILAVVLYIVCFIIMLVVHLLSKRDNLERTLPAVRDTTEA